MRRAFVVTIAAAIASGAAPAESQDAPRPPAAVQVTDHPWDHGDRLDVSWELSPDDVDGAVSYRVYVGGAEATELALSAKVPSATVPSAVREVTLSRLVRDTPYLVQVTAVGPSGLVSAPARAPRAVTPTRQWFDGSRGYLALIVLVFCGAVVYWIDQARRGRELNIRKIAGLEAVDEAVGRSTEMGRPCLFVAGIQDMNDIQTIAGISILSRVSRIAAEFDARVEVPTSRALVMTAARETVQASYLAAGRPDAYDEDLIYYVTDEQFGYVAYVQGMMVREKPAACFYMGAFYAESLILAETGNTIGAIQVAGTAMPAQLPFFVAACDYTLIGEEFFAASAYLSGEPHQLGSLKGQDVGKLIVGAGIIAGTLMSTVGGLLGADSALGGWLLGAVDYLKHVILI